MISSINATASDSLMSMYRRIPSWFPKDCWPFPDALKGSWGRRSNPWWAENNQMYWKRRTDGQISSNLDRPMFGRFERGGKFHRVRAKPAKIQSTIWMATSGSFSDAPCTIWMGLFPKNLACLPSSRRISQFFGFLKAPSRGSVCSTTRYFKLSEVVTSFQRLRSVRHHDRRIFW